MGVVCVVNGVEGSCVEELFDREVVSVKNFCNEEVLSVVVFDFD